MPRAALALDVLGVWPSHPYLYLLIFRSSVVTVVTMDTKSSKIGILYDKSDGVTAKILEASESTILSTMTIAPDAAVGRRDLRVMSPNGSFVQLYQVGSLPEQLEAEPNDDWRSAASVKMPVTINGRVTRRDYDHFRFGVEAELAGLFRTGDCFSSENPQIFLLLSQVYGHLGQSENAASAMKRHRELASGPN